MTQRARAARQHPPGRGRPAGARALRAGVRVSLPISPTEAAIRFDPERIFAMGHSQGGLPVPLMLPFAKRVKGAMLSAQAPRSPRASSTSRAGSTSRRSRATSWRSTRPTRSTPSIPCSPWCRRSRTFGRRQLRAVLSLAGGRGIDMWATQGLLDTYAPQAGHQRARDRVRARAVGPLDARCPACPARPVTADPPVSANIDAVRRRALHRRVFAVPERRSLPDHAEPRRRSAAHALDAEPEPLPAPPARSAPSTRAHGRAGSPRRPPTRWRGGCSCSTSGACRR